MLINTSNESFKVIKLLFLIKGNHVFSCESWDEIESWMEGIRAAVEDDRSKSTKKSGMSTVLGTMGPSQPRDALGTPGSMDPPKPNPLDMESEIDTPNEKQDPLSTSSSGRRSLEKMNTFYGL